MKKINLFIKKIFKKRLDPDIVRDAIIDYRKDGKKLMEKLGEKYELDITVDEEYQKLVARRSKSVNRKGTLSKRWNYAFHGRECNFYNKKHQQTVEVVLYNPPDFGYIYPWFLMIYMQLTKNTKERWVILT